MAKPTGFLDHARRTPPHRPVAERIGDYLEVELPLPPDELTRQAARCMDCGIPFCHGWGCPLANRVPEFNDMVYRTRWREALAILHATNNFPEITGRICPAPCEAACTLSINDEPVLIRHIELQIAERGWQAGWIRPNPAAQATGRKVAVIGSGPAGLAAAQQLARAGHNVTVFEKDDRIGGLLRYGIPDFKLDKRVLDRRLDQLRAEGVQFEPAVEVGADISPRYLRRTYDAVVLALGAGRPRDLRVPGRGLENVHFALEYLSCQNRLNAGDDVPSPLTAAGRVVAVIGGGDTGSDCVGTAVRQGAKQVHQLEILPAPPRDRNPQTPWPQWPNILRTSTSHEEGCTRRWGVLTKRLSGRGIHVEHLHACRVEWVHHPGGWRMRELAGTDFTLDVDMVLLAMGFLHVTHTGLIEKMGLTLDDRGSVKVDADGMTSQAGVFAAGDAVAGASLAVRAIQAGREVAPGVDRYLRARPDPPPP